MYIFHVHVFIREWGLPQMCTDRGAHRAAKSFDTSAQRDGARLHKVLEGTTGGPKESGS